MIFKIHNLVVSFSLVFSLGGRSSIMFSTFVSNEQLLLLAYLQVHNYAAIQKLGMCALGTAICTQSFVL